MPSSVDERFPGGNYLDWLMNLDPLELSAQNIDEIIDIHRKARADIAAGGKPKRLSEGQKIDLQALGLIRPKAKIVRRNIT
jgi:hypothetical protein